MTKGKKTTIELGMNQLALGIRAFEHLIDAYKPGTTAGNPEVAAANKAVVTVLEAMRKMFSKELGKLLQHRP